MKKKKIPRSSTFQVGPRLFFFYYYCFLSYRVGSMLLFRKMEFFWRAVSLRTHPLFPANPPPPSSFLARNSAAILFSVNRKNVHKTKSNEIER